MWIRRVFSFARFLFAPGERSHLGSGLLSALSAPLPRQAGAVRFRTTLRAETLAANGTRSRSGNEGRRGFQGTKGRGAVGETFRFSVGWFPARLDSTRSAVVVDGKPTAANLAKPLASATRLVALASCRRLRLVNRKRTTPRGEPLRGEKRAALVALDTENLEDFRIFFTD